MMGEFESLHRLAGGGAGWQLGPEIVHVSFLAVACGEKERKKRGWNKKKERKKSRLEARCLAAA